MKKNTNKKNTKKWSTVAGRSLNTFKEKAEEEQESEGDDFDDDPETLESKEETSKDTAESGPGCKKMLSKKDKNTDKQNLRILDKLHGTLLTRSLKRLFPNQSCYDPCLKS